MPEPPLSLLKAGRVTVTFRRGPWSEAMVVRLPGRVHIVVPASVEDALERPDSVASSIAEALEGAGFSRVASEALQGVIATVVVLVVALVSPRLGSVLGALLVLATLGLSAASLIVGRLRRRSGGGGSRPWLGYLAAWVRGVAGLVSSCRRTGACSGVAAFAGVVYDYKVKIDDGDVVVYLRRK